MRVVAEIPHPEVKITVFSWNGKYLVKLERGPFEQTYKISEMDITGEAGIKEMLDSTFFEEVLLLFQEMGKAWRNALSRAEGF